MTSRIVVFKGSKKDFNNLLQQDIAEYVEKTPFMEVIQLYNARLRPNESGVRDNALGVKVGLECCVVNAEDYGSVLEHVLVNFVNILTLNHDIELVYVHNPPNKVLKSLESRYSDEDIIEYKNTEYECLSRLKLQEVYKSLNKQILGQESCKKQLLGGLYRTMTSNTIKPAVFLMYGPSGVGKTETAKCLSFALGGEVQRIQFSMMQSTEAYNYVFGSEHSKGSLAKDLFLRETNVVLIDEFDKVSPVFYNAFYELFDDGVFRDTHYNITLENTIILCTSNFDSEMQIKEVLGPAMFSRINSCVPYEALDNSQKEVLVDKWYSEVLESLQEDEKSFIEASTIRSWFLSNVGRFDNIRTLKIKLENAVYEKLVEEFILHQSE